MGFKRFLKPGETVVLRLPTMQERRRAAILLGAGFPTLAAMVSYLYGSPPVSEMDFWRHAGVYAVAGLAFMLAGNWMHRPRIVVTDRHILVRRGPSWRRHDWMAVRDVAGMDYDLKSKTLSLYGDGSVLTLPCDELGKARIMVALAGSD